MINKYSRPLRILALVLIMLAVASLACGIPGGGGGEEPEEAEEAGAEAEAYIAEEPASKPTKEPTPEPTEEPTPAPTATPTEEPTPEPAKYITVENAGDVVQLRSIAASPTALTAVAYSPTENVVATYGFSKIISVWDIDSGSDHYDLSGPSEYGFALQFSPDGTKLAAGGYDYRAYMWDLTTKSLLYQIQTNTAGWRVSFSPDGSQLAIAGELNSRAQIVDTENGAPITELRPSRTEVWAVNYSPDGKYIAVGDAKGLVVVYSAKDFSTVAELRAPSPDETQDVEFAPDGSTLATGYDAGSILIYETGSWARTKTIKAHEPTWTTAGLYDMVYTKDSKAVISVGGDGTFAIWDVESGTQLMSRNIGVAVYGIGMSGDGTKVALATDDGTLVIMGLPAE
jgi:WD40 repeat protein